MLKNIRRNSKQFLESRRKSIATLPPPPDANPTPPTPKPRNLTFFDLPAELRNDIYTTIATETHILVPLPSKKPPKSLPPTPSLLLVSKQIRQEYLPLLLEHSSINFQIQNLDFHHLIRILRSLYSSELKSLRLNPHLAIRLWVDRWDAKAAAALRRWLVSRAEHLDRLGFVYGVAWPRQTQLIPTSTQVHKVNVFMQRRLVLGQNLGVLGELHNNVEEALQFELQPIMNLLEREERTLGADPQLPWTGNTALLMYGIPVRPARW